MLVMEYAPALVMMGIHVRQCYWVMQGPDSGVIARDVLRDALCLQVCLEKTWKTEYIRNLVIMDLLWTKFHDGLPAAAFVEECLESSLSTLARSKRTDPRATTVQEFSDLYGALGPRSLVPKSQVKSGISRYFHHRLRIRLTAMGEAIKSAGLPGVVRGKAFLATGCPDWDVDVPGRLVSTIDVGEYQQLAAHALNILLDEAKGQRDAKAAADRDTMAALQPEVHTMPAVYVAQLVSENAELREELRQLAKKQKRQRGAPATADAMDDSEATAGADTDIATSSSALRPRAAAGADEGSATESSDSSSDSSTSDDATSSSGDDTSSSATSVAATPDLGRDRHRSDDESDADGQEDEEQAELGGPDSGAEFEVPLVDLGCVDDDEPSPINSLIDYQEEWWWWKDAFPPPSASLSPRSPSSRNPPL
jgi:hypothetical protein